MPRSTEWPWVLIAEPANAFFCQAEIADLASIRTPFAIRRMTRWRMGPEPAFAAKVAEIRENAESKFNVAVNGKMRNEHQLKLLKLKLQAEIEEATKALGPEPAPVRLWGAEGAFADKTEIVFVGTGFLAAYATLDEAKQLADFWREYEKVREEKRAAPAPDTAPALKLVTE